MAFRDTRRILRVRINAGVSGYVARINRALNWPDMATSYLTSRYRYLTAAGCRPVLKEIVGRASLLRGLLSDARLVALSRHGTAGKLLERDTIAIARNGSSVLVGGNRESTYTAH